MADQIAELRDLLDSYRRRSKSVRFTPVATAYAQAADDLEEMVLEITRNAPLNSR